MDFKKYCYSKNEFPEEYKSFSTFFESWRDFFLFVTKYNDDSKRKISTEATLSYLIIASFMHEIQDCLDGLSILAKEYSTKNMVRHALRAMPDRRGTFKRSEVCVGKSARPPGVINQ